MPAKQQKVKLKKKSHSRVLEGVAHIQATFNNTIVTITDLMGNTLAWSSAGSNDFKHSRKATQHAAKITADNVAAVIKDKFGLQTLKIKIKGPGPGRELAAKALAKVFKVTEIDDVTPVPFNGTRAEKPPRV